MDTTLWPLDPITGIATVDNLLDRSIRFDSGPPRGSRVFRRCLIVLLISSLLFPPSVFGSSQIAVLELFHPDLDTDLTGRLADRVRSDLREKGEPVVSREETAFQPAMNASRKC